MKQLNSHSQQEPLSTAPVLVDKNSAGTWIKLTDKFPVTRVSRLPLQLGQTHNRTRRTVIPPLYLPKQRGSFQKENAVTHSSWVLFDHMLFFSRAPCEHNADEIQSCVTKASVKDLIEMKACSESAVAWAFGILEMIFWMHWHVTSLDWRHRTVTQPRRTHLSESACFHPADLAASPQQTRPQTRCYLMVLYYEVRKCPVSLVLYIVQMLGEKNPGKRSPEISSFDSLQLVEIFNSKGLFTRRLALNS